MKKGILFGVVCAAVLFISTFVACNSNEPQLSGTNPSNDDPYVELMQNLDDFHADYMANHPSEGSRGFKSFFKKLIKCVKADCFAVTIKTNPLVLTIGFSPCASYAAWCNGYSIITKSEYEDYRLKLIQNEGLLCQIVDAVSSHENSDLGNKHNKVLIELFKRCTPEDSYAKIALTAVQISREMGFTNSQVNVIGATSRELTNFMNNIFDESDEVMVERMKTRCPEKANEIDVIKNYFFNLEKLNSVEEVKVYTERYKAIVEASNISLVEKTELINGLDVAPASMELWSKVITED